MKEPVCIIMCVRSDKVCEIVLNELITYFLNLFPKLANVTCGSHLCEYGLIYPDRELTTKALTEFFDGNVSESTVFRHLTKHFKRIGKYKNSEYRNPRGALENNKQAFKLTEPKYMRLN